jgi:hypothetical protein
MKKNYIFEDGPLGDGWVLITGGSKEIKQKTSEGCKVERASDGKNYYKCPTNNTDKKPWPDEYKCVTTGTKQTWEEDTEFGIYYTLKIDNEDWGLSPTGWARKSSQSYWTHRYKCDNGTPKIYSVCDEPGKELKGKGSDLWEYKKSEFGNDIRYCVRKGTLKWKYLVSEDPKWKKAIDAVAKKFETEGGNTEIVGNTEIGGDKKKEEVKYPSKAPQNIVARFDTNFPCLKELPTMVNLNKDGNEYYYKVETPTEDETVYYYMSGKCKIKTGDQLSPIKYFRCP